MSPQSLSDSQLIQELKNTVIEERKITALVLEYLYEVDRRRLFGDSGYSSLWDFCTLELGYSAASASRRISAMRLIREIPALKDDLLSGKQNLSSLSKAKHFFQLEEKHQGEKMSPEEKKEILQELENKSSRECERTLLELSSVPIEISNPQRERLLDSTHTELRIVLKDEVYFKLKRIQALRSHADPSMNYENLLNYMADEILKRIDPIERAKSETKRGKETKKQRRFEHERGRGPGSSHKGSSPKTGLSPTSDVGGWQRTGRAKDHSRRSQFRHPKIGSPKVGSSYRRKARELLLPSTKATTYPARPTPFSLETRSRSMHMDGSNQWKIMSKPRLS